MTAPVPHGPWTERTTVLSFAADDPGGLDVRRALTALAGVEAATLAPLLRTSGVPGGAALTHRVPEGAVTVAELRERGPLRVAHVLTVAVSALEALTPLHAVGLAHGCVDADHLLVGMDGAVVLTGTGAGWTRAPGHPDAARASDDVEAVGVLLRDLFGSGSAPAPIVVAAVRACDPDLLLRPDAGSLLDSLRRCGRPDPLLDALWAPTAASGGLRVDAVAESTPISARAAGERPSGAGTAPPRPARTSGSRARRIRRGWSVCALALLATTALGRLVMVSTADAGPARDVLAVASPGFTSQPSGRASSEAPADTGVAPSGPASVTPVGQGGPDAATTDWRTVLDGLDAGRRAALGSGDVVALARWDDPRGPSYSEDRALLDRMRAAQAEVVGGSLVVDAVRVRSVTGQRAVLEVRDRRGAYTVRTPTTRAHVGERAARWWRIVLSPSGAGWRLSAVQQLSG